MEIAIFVALVLNLVVSVLNLLAAARHERLASYVVGEIQASKSGARQPNLQ